MARVGIVVVSHSRALAEAALALAGEMVQGEQPPVRIAAGMPDGGLGTDAAAVADAITAVADGLDGAGEPGTGVLVLTDLGSAVLSAEMAVEFLPDPDLDVWIVPAPFVEGLLVALTAAAGGADLDAAAAQAAAALEPKREQLGGTDVPEAGPTPGPGPAPGPAEESGDEGEPERAEADVVLANATGLHARPAARVAALAAELGAEVTVAVPGRTPAAATSPLALAGLGTRGGDTVTVSARGPGADAAVGKVAELIGSGFGEPPEQGEQEGQPEGGSSETQTAEPATVPTAEPTTVPRRGLGVSPGRVVGQVARMPEPLPAPDLTLRVEPERREAEASRLPPAAAEVESGLRAAAGSAQGEAAEILQATAALAADPDALERAGAAVRRDGLSAEGAAWTVLGEIAEAFRAGAGRQAERATDVLDVRGRWLAALRGEQPPGVPLREEPYVLVARDLAPADTAGLDAARCLGIVSAEGGPTSHTAILARALGVPAVVGSPQADGLRDGETVMLDGSTGEVVSSPSPEQAATARSRPAAGSRPAPLRSPVTTADGHPVAVLANIGSVRDVRAALEAGAAGVGLFRTEFLFLDRTSAPDEDEQARLYAEVLRAVAAEHPGAEVVMRTLDAGSDKPLPFLTPAAEENPALGVRGLRTAQDHPEVLTTQLRAMARAAAEVSEADVWVMAPMVATGQGAAWFASLAREAGLGRVGVMVETPAAALCSAAVFQHVDFVSLGTNDLTQYTMAADRLSAPLAALNDPWQPAVLALVRAAVEGSGGKPVGVCGEAAADPLLARVLVGLGVSSLSMSPAAVPLVGSAVGASSLADCELAARAALATGSPAQARAAAEGVLGTRGGR